MPDSVQLGLGPALVERLDGRGEDVQKPDPASQSEELGSSPSAQLPLKVAKAQLGGCVGTAIRRTGSARKEFGDSSMVDRVCRGEIGSVLARVWAREDSRREFVKSVVEESGLFECSYRFEEKKRSA